MAQKSHIDLPESSEYVCLSQSVERSLYAVGSKALITLVDPRTSSVVRKIPTHCSHQNIRSISFSDNVCSIGTGSGSVLFYDLKKDEFFAEKTCEEEPYSRKRTSYLSCSEGYTVCHSPFVFCFYVNAISVIITNIFSHPQRHDALYYEAFLSNMEYQPAIYTHCFDSSSLRLFVAGGPLPANVSGHYAALWS